MKIAVIGASGRMGKAVIDELAQQQLTCVAAIVGDQSASLGQRVTTAPEQALFYTSGDELTTADIDVVIDFSLPEALAHNLTLAERLGAAMVVCTTGLETEQQQLLQRAATSIPLLYAANTSVGICVLEQLVAVASAAMPATDIEILEAHHSAKRDAPSGTALALAQAAAGGRGQHLAACDAQIRGPSARRPGSIGFAVQRAADIIGEHSVLMAQPGERLELNHRVSDRRVFARGAVQAAQWLAQQPAGYYQMRDMLDLNTVLKQLLAEI